MPLEWQDPIHYETGGGFTWPDKDGVYVIAKKIDGVLKARYVGQGNLRDRMKVHESSDEPNKCLKGIMSDRDDVKVYYALVPNDTERNNAEYTVFYYYGGVDKLCNEATPQGELLYNPIFPFEKVSTF